MIVYKTVLLQEDKFVSSYMNNEHFSQPYLQKEYVLNQTTYMTDKEFPLYAWASYGFALRGQKRYPQLSIFECVAHKYYGTKVYNITNESSLKILKQPEYKKLFLVDLLQFPLEDLGIILCSSITPLKYII